MPLEIITFLASTVLGGIMSLIGLKIKKNSQLQEAQLLALNAKAKIQQEARQHDDKGFKVTRRIIALTVTFAVILLPLLAPYVSMYSYLFTDYGFPHIPVTFGYTELKPGFWPFTSDMDLTKWVVFDKGFIITPFHTHMMAGISGFYFGTNSSKV